MKLYGSYQNRVMENCNDSLIEVGTGCTEFSYSDREAYEVIAVKDQKHVTIRRYDHRLRGVVYSNDWELVSNENNPTYDVVKRGNYWYTSITVTKEELENIENVKDSTDRLEKQLWLCHNGFDKDVVFSKGKQTKYHRMNIRFWHADYYYDYSF